MAVKFDCRWQDYKYVSCINRGQLELKGKQMESDGIIDIVEISFHSSYKISHNYQVFEGEAGAKARMAAGADRDEAFRALKARVRAWLVEDYRQNKKNLHIGE